MYLYNTTFVVEIPHVEPWKQWLSGTYIAQLAAHAPQATFETYELDGRIEHTPGTRTFSCQCHCPTISELREVENLSGSLLCAPNGPQSMSVVFFCSMMKKLEL